MFVFKHKNNEARRSSRGHQPHALPYFHRLPHMPSWWGGRKARAVRAARSSVRAPRAPPRFAGPLRWVPPGCVNLSFATTPAALCGVRRFHRRAASKGSSARNSLLFYYKKRPRSVGAGSRSSSGANCGCASAICVIMGVGGCFDKTVASSSGTCCHGRRNRVVF